ncbi:hypothetical protein NVP1139A_15 [Vibrio phage 1.139.A._10N.261.48.C6]|nr:hypothetical protein NVP1139A_15 [Vibrio phage 1.139.A._10N.261.48.C6]AUR90250.1 hypothetical protein NVP1139B_15 [Vibrio phage 1.139.B._10N.261.48.C6]
MARESITTGATGGNKRRAATHYGRRVNDTEHLAKLHLKHGEEVLEVTFRYDTFPALGEDELILRIPQYAQVQSARLQVTVPFVGGDALKVGTGDSEGGNLSEVSLVTETDAPVADIGAIGAIIDGTGTLVGGNAIPDERQVYVTQDGTFTAGEATLTVIYRRYVDRADQFNDDL